MWMPRRKIATKPLENSLGVMAFVFSALVFILVLVIFALILVILRRKQSKQEYASDQERRLLAEQLKKNLEFELSIRDIMFGI